MKLNNLNNNNFATNVLKTIVNGNDLSYSDAERLFEMIMSGKASEIEISAIISSLATKGESEQEILAATKILRKKSKKIISPNNTLDTCGTGGDSLGTYNISTAVAIVAASCGISVAKHGNKSVSSNSGSSDILSALGVNINAEISTVNKTLKQIGLCFLMAPMYHSAMKHVSSVRSKLGIRTIFNLLGPLLNPANATRQLIGVYDKKWLKPIANNLNILGTKKAWIVHGLDGMDEITTCDNTKVLELNNNNKKSFIINPEKYGIRKTNIKNLKGGNAKENAEALISLLSGRQSAYKDIVLINTAAALIVADKCNDIKQGIETARKAIDNGKALDKLNELISMSNKNEYFKKKYVKKNLIILTLRPKLNL